MFNYATKIILLNNYVVTLKLKLFLEINQQKTRQ
jgi:hypothetical protein